ncbi:MAG TPA: twin-arginine translocase TatA/TatE family subunit [Anaerolineae bacterium]|nr:twin-arginine translocase TatA/TatE family subunit [Anaerolineae bacterium]
MPNLGPTELIIILVIVLLIFGAGKLASVGGALGRGIKDFRGAMKEGEASDEDEKQPDAATAESRSEPAKDQARNKESVEEA